MLNSSAAVAAFDDGADARPRPPRGALFGPGSTRGWSLLIACVGAVCFVLGQFAGAVQKDERVLRAGTVIAEKFELTGPGGRRVASLETDHLGATWLYFLDDKQSRRLSVGMTGRGEPTLMLLDSKGNSRLSIRVDPNAGTPSVLLSGEPRLGTSILLSIHADGPSMSLSQVKRGILSMDLDEQGQPKIELRGTGGERGVALWAGEDQHVLLTGKNGVPRASWGLDPATESPQMYLWDETGKIAASIRLTDDGKTTFRKLRP